MSTRHQKGAQFYSSLPGSTTTASTLHHNAQWTPAWTAATALTAAIDLSIGDPSLALRSHLTRRIPARHRTTTNVGQAYTGRTWNTMARCHRLRHSRKQPSNFSSEKSVHKEAAKTSSTDRHASRSANPFFSSRLVNRLLTRKFRGLSSGTQSMASCHWTSCP